MSETTRQLAAIMFTDIVGYTALNLPFDVRSEYLFKNGDYLTHREYYNQKRALYRCDDFLAEAWYDPLENEITKVELIRLEIALKFYWSSVEIGLCLRN